MVGTQACTVSHGEGQVVVAATGLSEVTIGSHTAWLCGRVAFTQSVTVGVLPVTSRIEAAAGAVVTGIAVAVGAGAGALYYFEHEEWNV